MLTSNLGSKALLEGAQQGEFVQAKKNVIQIVKQHFPPELINRFDDIVVFNPLSVADMRKIFVNLMKDLENRV